MYASSVRTYSQIAYAGMESGLAFWDYIHTCRRGPSLWVQRSTHKGGAHCLTLHQVTALHHTPTVVCSCREQHQREYLTALTTRTTVTCKGLLPTQTIQPAKKEDLHTQRLRVRAVELRVILTLALTLLIWSSVVSGAYVRGRMFAEGLQNRQARVWV